MSNIVLADEKGKLFNALGSYASALSNLSDEQVPEAFEMTDKLGKLAEEVRDRLRSRLLKWVKETGATVTEKGSRANSIGGFRVSAIPTRTGIDPKKLEALLRRLALDPAVGMTPTITYAVNEEKVMALVESGRLTTEDLNNCRYSESFRIQVEKSRE